MRTIALLGGTGSEGRGLALRFALAGERVLIGSRSSSRAEQAATAVGEQVAPAADRILGRTNAAAAAEADLVCICLPITGLEQTLGEVRSALRGKLLIDVVNPIGRTPDGFELASVPHASAAEWIAAMVPESTIVSAFKTLSARQLADLTQPLEGDAFVCGDREDAKREILDLVARIPVLRPVDCGPLRNARYVEAATVLLLELNRRHRATTSLRIVGLDSIPH